MKNQKSKIKVRSLIFFSVLCTVIMTSPTSSYGQTLYISTDKGRNNAQGTAADPLLTLDEAVSKANKFTGKEPVTLILGPGLYTITHRLIIKTANVTDKEKTFTIQAQTLPGDSKWKPEDLPVVLSISPDNATFEFPHCEGLFIAQSNVTIKGIKFVGNPNNKVRDYYPIMRQDKTLNGLNVSQCYFIGEANSSPIQSSFWAYGSGIHVDHCIFHNSKIAFVLSSNVNDFSLTYSIIDGAYNTAIWYGFAKTMPKFVIRNDVFTNCYYVMVYPVEDGQPSYTFSDSYITNNAHYLGNYPKAQDRFFSEPNKHIHEVNIHKSGAIKFVDVADDGITKDNLNLSSSSAGKSTGAGIFSK